MSTPWQQTGGPPPHGQQAGGPHPGGQQAGGPHPGGQQAGGHPTGGHEPANPWAAPAPPLPWGPPAVYQHPKGTTVLVLGILSIIVLPVLGPFAWAMGRSALREVDSSPTPVANRSTLVAGMVLGIIGTVFTVLGLIWFLMVVGAVFAMAH